jgi:hypothetical protein
MGAAPNAQEIIDDTDQMQADRAVFASTWQEIRDWICPLQIAVTSRETAGAKSHGNVLDGSGEDAGEMLAAALVSMETPQTDIIFELRTDDDRVNKRHDVKVWLQAAADTMHNVLRSPRGLFQQTQHQKKIDQTFFGTAGGFIVERPGKIISASVPLRQLLIAEDDDGVTNKVHRDFERTARQAFGRWGGALPAKIIQCATDPKRSGEKFRFIHAVCPRRERDYQSAKNTDLPFASTYVSCEEKMILGDSGFHELPYQTPRNRKRGDESYGRGPGFKALGDVKSLQRAWRITFRGAEKRIDPPLLVADNGVTSAIRTNSSGLTYYRAGTWSTDPIKPLNTGGDVALGFELIDRLRAAVEMRFSKPLIQMIRQDRMTATEVLKVDEEQQRLVGPFLDDDKAQDLGPMIERVFWILFRAGVFAPMPEAMQGRDLRVEYVAPALRAQRVGRARGLAQFNELTATMQAANQALADNLDEDLIFRDTGDALGLPATWFRDDATVIKMRDARQQVQNAKAQRDALLQTTETMANAVRALPALKAVTEGGQLAA